MTCRTFRNLLLTSLGLSMLLSGYSAVQAATPTEDAKSGSKSQAQERATVVYGKLPLSFEPNQGQTSDQVQWLARGPAYTLFLAGNDAVLELNSISEPSVHSSSPRVDSSVVRMNLLGAQPASSEAGEEMQTGKSNYLTGNDPSKWQRNVPMYGKVSLKSVYPGIDLLYYGRQGQLEYDFVVAPGADPSRIRWGFDGAKTAIDSEGNLVLTVDGSGREVHLQKPVAYQMQNGNRELVSSSFVLAGNGQASFNLAPYDKSRELIIDPTLIFLGVVGSGQGNNSTQPNGMAVDAAGEMILTGATTDITFPVTSGALQTTCNTHSALFNQNLTRCPNGINLPSAFVSKISADGTSLVFSTYLHGLSGFESGQAVAVDSNNNEVVLGATSSADFPITANAYENLCQPIWNGANEVQECDGYFNGGGTEYTVNGPVLFIAKLDPTGANLLYGTFVGGSAVVNPRGLALDSSDNMYFTGFVQNAWPQASLYPNNGSNAVQFPTTASAFQSYGANDQVASLSVLSADGSTMLYSTLFGATDTSGSVGYTQPFSLAVGPNGMAYIGGVTTSADLPTVNAFKPHCTATTQICVTVTAWLAAFNTKLSGNASLAYATYVGGTELNFGTNNQANQVSGLLADSSNNLFITGSTSNSDFPTTAGVYQPTCASRTLSQGVLCWTGMGFLTKLNPSGAITWSTYFGGTNGNSQTVGNAIALDAKGQVYLYGYNNDYGGDLPVVNPIIPGDNGNFAFVATFSPDATKLLFSSPVFESCCSSFSTNAIPDNGIALDSAGNIYAAAYGNDGGALVTTTGTYATTGTGPGWRSFFTKISPVLPLTTTTLGISPNPGATNQPITFTVTVAGITQTTPSPTGTVTLTNVSTNPATVLGTIILAGNGTGMFQTSSLAAGTYSITGSYSGDSNYDVSTSTAQALTINVGPATPTVTVSPTSSSITATQSDSVMVSVSGGGSNPTPTGSVKLTGGGYTSAATTLTSGAATIVIPAGSLSAGNDIMSATYTPDSASSSNYTSATGTNTITVSLAAQAINFTAPTSPIAYTTTPITLSATGGGSGNPVVFSILSGPGTISGSALTVTGVGTIVIAANQAGNAEYSAAPQVQQSVVVNQASQTISFTAASPVTFTTTPITLSATGGGSGNPVVFSLVSGPATLSGNKLTLTGVGSVVLAANQAGNANYTAAPQVQQTIVVNVIGTVSAPTFMPAAGTYTSAQTVTISSTTSGAAIYYTTDGSTPPTSPTAVLYTSPVSVTASETINAIAVETGYTSSTVATAAYVLPVTFTVSFSPSTLTIQNGQSGTTTVSVTPQNGFKSPVTFACSGLPSGASCTFNPASVTPSGNTASTSTLTIATNGTSAAVHGGPIHFLPETTLALTVFLFAWTKRRNLFQLVALFCIGAVGFSLMSGCGGSTKTPTTATVTVTASAGGTQQTGTLTVTINY